AGTGGEAWALPIFRLLEPATGKELRVLEDEEQLIYSVAFSKNGKTLVAGGGGTSLTLWEVATGKKIRQIRDGFAGRAWSVPFAPDGRTVAAGAEGSSIHLWDSTTGKELRPAVGHRGWVRAVALAPDQQRVASAGHDGWVRLWDLATGKESRRFTAPRDFFTHVSLLPDGRALAVGWDTLRVWESATGKEILKVKLAVQGIASVALS